jgi:copper oxidase (laccase) domain-containing protein
MSEGTTQEGRGFSVMRVPGFAPAHGHAFILRGSSRRPLFHDTPIPRDEVSAAAGIAGATLHLPRQVHGKTALVVPRGSSAGPHSAPGSRADGELLPPDADAFVTREAGHAVGIVTADCLPILLASDRSVCGAVHAGWRGLLAGVVSGAIDLCRSVAARPGAGSDPAGLPSPSAEPLRIEAAIGPAIGPCCFEVGEEVASLFRSRFPGDARIVRPAPRAGKSFVDLPLAGSLFLEAAGISSRDIRIVRRCTRCSDDRLESYRRDGPGAGRMLALIGPGRLD